MLLFFGKVGLSGGGLFPDFTYGLTRADLHGVDLLILCDMGYIYGASHDALSSMSRQNDSEAYIPECGRKRHRAFNTPRQTVLQ